MRAWKCVTWGGPNHLKLGNVPDPECGAGQVEIMVNACGVNFADLLLISGRYQVRPELPFVPGMEVAGRITRVGEGCEMFSVGDKAAAYVKHGGYADRVVAPIAQVVKIPESISFSAAAAFPVSYGSAELALDRAGLSAGEVVVIGGAAGAVGAACVELVKHRGGLPPEILDSLSGDNKLRLPMATDSRSLNLSNTVSIAVYEAWRQLGF
ncbi:MAG: alcohol dehydrogenase catalytic domain-containing protein, partial [Planctomycetaceae bacterium]|nr:alcohol dehydrogenase catalytic domain-containing protein [Planctomycetaceae bacterium]